MSPLLERSHRAATARRRASTEPAHRGVAAGSGAAGVKDSGAAVRMRLKNVFVSTNAALVEPTGEAERIVVFAPQRTIALRAEQGCDIQAVVEGIRLVDWWPAIDGAAGDAPVPH